MSAARFIPVALFLVLIGVPASAAEVWRLLASTSVTATPPDATAPQRAEIRLPSARGSFTGIRLEVTGGTITLDRLVVTFAHGSMQAADLKNKTFESGGVTRVIELTGRDRVVRKVDFWYRTHGFVKVRLYAH